MLIPNNALTQFLKSNDPVLSAPLRGEQHFLNAIGEQNALFSGEDSELDSNAYVDRSTPESRVKQTIRGLISPDYPRSVSNVARLVDLCESETKHPVFLIIGAGTMGSGIEPLYESDRIRVIGVDVFPSPLVNLVCDAHRLPLNECSVDAVIIQAVLEHVIDPHGVVSEIHRVLKPGGLVYAETPFLQHVHEGAYDFTRFTESGHRYLFKKFELIDSGVIAGVGTQLLWSLEAFFRGLFRSWYVGKVVKILCFWIRFADKLIPEHFNRDAASCVYFLGRSSNKEISAKELIAFYSNRELTGTFTE